MFSRERNVMIPIPIQIGFRKLSCNLIRLVSKSIPIKIIEAIIAIRIIKENDHSENPIILEKTAPKIEQIKLKPAPAR